MATFLTIHTGYQNVELGLFQEKRCIARAREQNKRISKYFLSFLQELLSAHNVLIEDLTFIAANQGPAPFTTLRVMLASINGLSFATNIPLVGVDCLYAFVLG